MRIATLFPHLTGFHPDEMRQSDGHLILTATAIRTTARCPLCYCRSRRVHSRYRRRVADCPAGGTPATLLLHVRRFFCRNPRCLRRVFAERLPALVAAGERRSQPLRAVLKGVAFALGGDAGARLASALGMPTTADILLRLIRAAPLPAIGTPERVGVDDFALRKGRVCAGLIIDHEERRPLDVLPDCAPVTIADWLATHPSVRLVSRDPPHYGQLHCAMPPPHSPGTVPRAFTQSRAEYVGTTPTIDINESMMYGELRAGRRHAACLCLWWQYLPPACRSRGGGEVIHHSDQGSRYTSLAFGRRRRGAGMTAPTSRRATPPGSRPSTTTRGSPTSIGRIPRSPICCRVPMEGDGQLKDRSRSLSLSTETGRLHSHRGCLSLAWVSEDCSGG